MTGSNVANIKQEFKISPLNCNPKSLTVKKSELPEQGKENIELLETLLTIRAAEIEPDILTELDGLINNVCVQ